MTRGRSSGRIKTGNIILFLLLGLGIYYLFNKSTIDQQLIDAGVLEPKGEIELVEDLDDTTSDVDEVAETTTDDTSTSDSTPEAPASPKWSILTEGVDEFYLDEINKFTVRSDKELGVLVPVVMGKGVTIKTVDEAKGLYELIATKEGSVEINLFGNVGGKRGIMGEKSFNLVKRVGQKNSDYLWDISTVSKDTLFIGKGNNVIALIAEVDSKDLILEVEKGTAKLVDSDAGWFDVKVESGKTATIKLFIKKDGKKTFVGEKIFLLIDLATVDKANLVAYYSFNDCTALESISGEQKGNLGINPACVQGVLEQCMSFDGKDDYVVFDDMVNDLLEGKNNFSISFYYAHDSYKSDRFSSLFNKRATCKYEDAFNVGVSGTQLSVSLYGKAKPMEKQSVKVSIKSKGWQHYVITRQNNILKVFVNGKLVGETKGKTTISLTDFADVMISATPCNTGHNTNRLKGKMDELKFYSGVLNDIEILNLYKNIPLLPIPPKPADVDVADNNSDTNTTNDTTTSGSACGTKILNQILFVGINNPIQVEVGDVPAKELLVEFEKQVIQPDRKGIFSVKPKKIGQKKLEVYRNKNGQSTLLTSAIFQAKESPHPIPYVEGKSGGNMSAVKFKKATKITAKLHLLDFDTKFEITNFKLSHYTKTGIGNKGVENRGAIFNSSVRSLISQAKRGDVYVFSDIKVAEEDSFGFSRQLSSIAFTVE